LFYSWSEVFLGEASAKAEAINNISYPVRVTVANSILVKIWEKLVVDGGHLRVELKGF